MLIRVLRTHLRPHRVLIVVVVTLQLVQSGASLVLPALNGDIIDKGIAAGDTGKIWSLGGLMLSVSLVQVGFAVGAVYVGVKLASMFGRDVRNALFHRVTAFSAREVGALGAPSLITRITNDVQQVQLLVAMTCTFFLAAPITAIGGVVMALREDVGLSGLLAVSIPALIGVIGVIVARMIPQYRRMQERIDAVNRVLREQITGIRVVRAFVREPHEAARFAAVNDDLTDTSLRAGRLMAMIFPAVLVVLNTSSVAVLWFGADRVSAGSLSVGSLVAFLSYLVQILWSVTMATFIVSMVPRAAVCAERIQEVLDTPSSVIDTPVPVEVPPLGSGLELRNVSFRYPGAEDPVLNDVSFTARPGTTTAIIGSTGSGKTTLLGLVPRLFDVTSGSVRLGGVAVTDLALDSLRARIGLVPQKPYLFSGTVASNLRYGRDDATDDELWQALAIAQAADFVAAMPGGLDAPIVQGGSNVSGGQRQRLAIARALVRRPQIYLFDDSFSALDLATDARLRAAMAPHVADSIVLVVAQRVSTIADADQIVVLEHGRVVGLGRHDELIHSSPTYAEIVASQRREDDAA